MKVTFNKVMKNKRSYSEPSVIFRKLSKTGNHERYQGSINTSGIELAKKVCKGNFSGFQVMFSDEHSIVGIKPEFSQSGKCNSAFGATQLFSELNLKTGFHYILKINDGFVTIDSDEH